uniref:Major capsid protein N-terminal domain-containing protein n=1 Tax=viral metagenome TaxID=1070528 RepID=A0A6C0FB38_9ZZZZ|tara:strand:+ start:27152 stop:28351 length:1200 start_codon:yes stop_codon:yes gene_type:complete
MGGGLMQLVAYGAQDIYLTGNPQITFFKVVYRRHTNFSMEAIQQTFSGSLGDGKRQTATISRNGDLIYRMYFQAELKTNASNLTYFPNAGSFMIDNVEIEIGGQTIDKHTGDWMEVFSELTERNTSAIVSDGSSNGGTLFQNMSGMGGVNAGQHWASAAPPLQNDSFTRTDSIYVPLQFWFCRNPGLALPLIALQYHEVKLIVEWNSVANSAPTSCDLYVDYIYLDTDERRRFAQVSHEYLIEQLQYHSLESSTVNELNFNHPVKELIWTNIKDASYHFKTLVDTNYNIKLNGHDRFESRPKAYFTRTQIWQHHTGPGGLATDISITDYASCNLRDTIGIYSFALKPEEHQPSGTCNFSRIDNAQLVTDPTALEGGTIYAVNYNVLRIMSGMGGLAYSN